MKLTNMKINSFRETYFNFIIWNFMKQNHKQKRGSEVYQF